ncbi:unnamed protein product [Coregonus sp. 'balchen']|nr:unnamed protein product [Coregonus sp. 'balchen']
MECLKDLKHKFLQKERYENLSSVGEMKETLEELKKMMACGSQNKEAEAEHTKRLQKISSLRMQLEKHETQFTTLNQEIKDKQQALFKEKKELDKLWLEDKNIQVSMGAKLKRKNQLLASACINLKDPTLAVAVESCLRSFMKTFCCDNYKDEAVLQDLMGVNHPDYPSVLDSLSIANPVITNCLIDMRVIESILIIKEKDAARRVMQQGRPLRNCCEAFTVKGDQVYPNQYYTPDFSMAKYLRSELENYKAQFSRFHLHLSSVTEDIQRMEAKLHSTIMTLKIPLEFVAKAKEISPERQQVDRSAKRIDVEITRLRKKISVQESSHGDDEQVVREYAEALANYR